MENKINYQELAETLVELEFQSIDWDAPTHFDLNGWFDKYGEDSIKHVNDLEVSDSDIRSLAVMLKKDHSSDIWVVQEDGTLFTPDMRDYYGGYLTHCIEKHLASLTGVGYQMEITLK